MVPQVKAGVLPLQIGMSGAVSSDRVTIAVEDKLADAVRAKLLGRKREAPSWVKRLLANL
jgi:hypothetical protein